MNPISIALFLVGYGLALPIALRMPSVVAAQHRLAMWGHQLGMLIATLAWFLRGGATMGILHLAWMAIASAWFGVAPAVRSRRDGRST